MTRTWILLAAMTAWLGGTSSVLAEKVMLHDHRVVEGQIVSQPGDAMVVIRTPAGDLRYPAQLVKEIQLDADAPVSKPAAPLDAASLKPSERAGFEMAMGKCKALKDPAEGVAVWDGFLTQHPTGHFADRAHLERITWRQRADAGLVRFGPDWISREAEAQKNQAADDLIRRAEAASQPEVTLDLLNQAGEVHPWRVDIPFRKARIYYRQRQLTGYQGALGAVVRIKPDNLIARNNLGVMAAQKAHWTTALAHLAVAIAAGDDDRVFDNFDQVDAMAEAAGCPPDKLQRYDVELRRVILHLHRQGKHTNQTRWGNAWISQEQYEAYLKQNQDLARQVRLDCEKLTPLEKSWRAQKRLKDDYDRIAFVYYKGLKFITIPTYQRMKWLEAQMPQIQAEIARLENEGRDICSQIRSALGSRNEPSHAGQLILIGPEGAETLETLSADVRRVDKADFLGDRWPNNINNP